MPDVYLEIAIRLEGGGSFILGKRVRVPDEKPDEDHVLGLQAYIAQDGERFDWERTDTEPRLDPGIRATRRAARDGGADDR
jgi:hypothetical protein